jgi:2-phosphoglycerate kinase
MAEAGATRVSFNQGYLQHDLAHVLWIGGSPCAGKSSITRLLGDGLGLDVYHCDEAFADHRQTLDAAKHPMLFKWTTSTWDELWAQPVETLLSEAITCYREHFQLVVADLASLPASQPLLVEGNCLLPDLVRPWLTSRDQAIWVVTSADFVRTHYPKRGPWVQEIVNQCTDPPQALQNWMDREVRFAAWITERVQNLGLSLLLVDGTQTNVDAAARVEAHFGLRGQ